ncbi:MAG TPA: hypothetical protein VMS64_36375 [Candidatus Methylomirabilis sp.]|nr:hypothetical protein [Candidatus Methylomirabilis sp.]
MNTSATSLADAVPELAKTFTGQLIKPTDPAYDDARRIHNGLVDKRPALIARCRGVADIVAAVNCARRLHLEAVWPPPAVQFPRRGSAGSRSAEGSAG